MLPQNFTFIGRSGCGKGTQARLLGEHLSKVDSQREVFFWKRALNLGNSFRAKATPRDFLKKYMMTAVHSRNFSRFICGRACLRKVLKKMSISSLTVRQDDFMRQERWIQFLIFTKRKTVSDIFKHK